MTYRFIGTESDIGPIQLRTLGQSVELPDKLAQEAILGKCAILPAEQFADIFTDPSEVAKFPNPGAQVFAPAEFHDKLKAARVAFSELRAAHLMEDSAHG